MNAAYVIKKNIREMIKKPTKLSPAIETQFGNIQGRVSTSRDGRKYYQYLGIPYAKAPVGELRFQPPEPWTDKWEGIRDATKDGDKAVQFDALSKKVVGSEDCLFLGVHTPFINVADGGHPVLVWFHGGSFILGSGNDYKPDYFMEHDVVVVAVNYRLGCFGFLDTGDGLIRGNMGLKDQNMSLQWVRDNISVFGGNPNDITIAGESAGGASVHFHVLSPMSRGLFHKAISQSGMATLPFSLHPSPAKLARRFAEMLGCSTDNSLEMVKCLQKIDFKTLASVQLGMFDNFRPTIEFDFGDGAAFITDHPLRILESGNYNKVPYMTGVNSGEGLLLATPAVSNKQIIQDLDADWGKNLAPFLFFPEDADYSQLDKTKDIYLDGNFDPNDPMKSMSGMVKLFGDCIWNIGFHKAAVEHALQATREAPLYLYYYDYCGAYSLADMVLAIGGESHPLWEWIKIKGDKFIREKIKKEELPNYGPCHGDGLSMLWYMPSMCYVPKKSPDYDISREIVDTMVQFVKLDVNNNPCLKFSGVEWERQRPGETLMYMHIGTDPKMLPEPFNDRLEFWKNIEV